MKVLLAAAAIVLFILSCQKIAEKQDQANAEIIKFHAEKCMCCWGWDVKMGKDTIKINGLPKGVQLGYDINKSIPVLIELGKKQDCLAPNSGYPIYEVVSLKMSNK